MDQVYVHYKVLVEKRSSRRASSNPSSGRFDGRIYALAACSLRVSTPDQLRTGLGRQRASNRLPWTRREIEVGSRTRSVAFDDVDRPYQS